MNVVSVDQPVEHPYGFGLETGSYGNRKIPGSLLHQLSASLAGLSAVCDKEVLIRFDSGRLSVDGGLLLLHRIEGCGLGWPIASGYEDCHDLDLNRSKASFYIP
jgi:hypothetical protein